jgi:HEAT repeat protein
MELLSRMEGGQEVDRAILNRLRDTETVEARVDVIRVLGNRRVAGAVGDLLDQARYEDPEVRVAALRAMRRLVGPGEVAPLIAVVKTEPEGPGRRAAVNALASACGDDGPSGELVLAELKQATGTVDKDAWTRVLTATGYPKALPVILEDLESDDPEVVVGTITHLSRWPDPAPIEALLPLLEDGADPQVQRRAVSAAIQLTTTAVEREQRPEDVLGRWFAQADAAVETVEQKRQLLSGLARLHTLESFRLLEPYLEDPEVRTEALWALLSLGSPLAKAGHHEVIGKALPEESAIEEQELRWRFARLRKQVEAAE